MSYSILMSVFKNDNPNYLIQSIESMLKQTIMTNDFVIVVDGEIDSNIQSILNEYKKKYPNIFNYLFINKNQGLGYCLKKGLEICKNNYVARMDSDDISMPNRIENQLKMFELDPDLDIVGTQVLEFNDTISDIISIRSVPYKNKDIIKFLKLRDPFNHPSVVFKKTSIISVGNYNDYRKNQDTDLWIRLFVKGCKGANTVKPYLYFRFDNKTIYRRRSLTNFKTLLKIRWKSVKLGFNNIFEFIFIFLTQLFILIVPYKILDMIYKFFLRRKI